MISRSVPTPRRLTIFADFTCPNSHIMETALRRMSLETGDLIPRAYELFPEPTAAAAAVTDPDRLSGLRSIADELGIDLEPPSSRPTTRKAHEASRFAREQGREPELRCAIYGAYWSDGLDIGRIDVLTGLGAEIGLDPEAMRIALDTDRYTPEVLRDMEVARALRIPGTPTLFIGTGPRARVVMGAHSTADLQQIFDDTFRNGEDGSENG